MTAPIIPESRKLARRIGTAANRFRFVLWAGLMTVILLLILALTLFSSADDRAASDQTVRGLVTGSNSKHAYGYQGLARSLDAEKLGGQSLRNATAQTSASLRILVEPEVSRVGGAFPPREVFSRFVRSGRAPVLVIPELRRQLNIRDRLDGRGFVTGEHRKTKLGASNRVFEGIGLQFELEGPTTDTRGTLDGFDVAVRDMVQFEPGGVSKVWTLDDRPLIARVEIGGQNVYLLSDPDLLNNAGLANADNRAFVLYFLDFIREGDGPIVFDERDMREGSGSGLTLGARLFQMPLGIVSYSLLAVTFLLVWLTFGRFGPVARRESALRAGKDTAVEASLNLISGGDNNREVLRRYFDAQTRQLNARLGGPKTSNLSEQRRWLDAVAERRGVDEKLRLSKLEKPLDGNSQDALSERDAAGAAHTIHAFREAMLHDPRSL